MNFGIIILEVLFSIILFLLLNYLKRKKTSAKDLVIIPSIYMIIIASLIPNMKDITIGILILAIIFDILSLTYINKKDLLINEKSYYKTILLTLGLGFLVYYFFLLKVDKAFLDMNVFKNFIWLLIIIYILKKVDITSIKLKEEEINNFDNRYQEYVIVNYAKFKNQYNYLIKSKDKDIENILYSFLIYEDYLHGKLERLNRAIRQKFIKNNNIYGLMGVESDHFITDEEAISIMKERLETKSKRIKKADRDLNLKKLINEKYKETKDYKEIIKILNYIEEFNNNN